MEFVTPISCGCVRGNKPMKVGELYTVAMTRPAFLSSEHEEHQLTLKLKPGDVLLVLSINGECCDILTKRGKYYTVAGWLCSWG